MNDQKIDQKIMLRSQYEMMEEEQYAYIPAEIRVLEEDCEFCPHMELDMSTGVLWAEDKIVHRSIEIYCENIEKCRRLKARVEEKQERSERLGQ